MAESCVLVRQARVVADRALNLEHHNTVLLGVNLERLVELGLVAGLKGDVDDGAAG